MEVIIKVRDPKCPTEWIDVELVHGCTWEAITTALSTQLELLSREEIISVQSIDADGEPLSAKISQGSKFWAIVGNALDDEELRFDIQHDAELAVKLAKALEYEQFRASAAHLCFALASDVEQMSDVFVKHNCSWNELIDCVSREFSNIPADWIHHFTLVDNEGDELSDVLNTEAKFWKFASTYNRDSDNVFVIHFDEAKIAEMTRLEEEEKFKASAQKIRFRLAKPGEAPIFNDVFVSKKCSWAEIVWCVAQAFDVKPEWVQSFYYIDANGEKLSSILSNATKFWKFAGDLDPADSTAFDVMLDWDALAEHDKLKAEIEFQKNACKIVVAWVTAEGTTTKEDVYLPRGCLWTEIIDRVAEAVQIPAAFINGLVWLDSDGDELSSALISDAKFWRLAEKFNYKEGQYYKILPNIAAVIEAERMRLEKEFEDSSTSFHFSLISEPDKFVDIAISPRHTTWDSLLKELADHFPPLTKDWISGLTLTYERTVMSTNIESIGQLWESYERLRGGPSGGVSMESIISHGQFLINENDEFRATYERKLREEEEARLAAEAALKLQELKDNSKEIVAVLSGMTEQEEANVFVPLNCNSWEDFKKTLVDVFPSIETEWISYVILVDHLGEELSVPITDILKFWKLCGDEYSVHSGYKFMVHLNQQIIAEAIAQKEYAAFRASAAEFAVKFQYANHIENGTAYVPHDCDWDELILAVCLNLTNLVNAGTIDYLKMKDETGEDISSPIRSADKFWLVFPSYNKDEGMYFEVFDSQSVERLESEAKKNELLAGRVPCRFKLNDPDSLDFSDDLQVEREVIDVFVPSDCGWDILCETIAVAFTIPAKAVKHFILVDTEGDELSMVIDTASKFWKICDSYNLDDGGFTLNLYVDEIGVKDFLAKVARKRFEANAASFRVFVQDDDGSKGPEVDVFVNYDCSWDEITEAVMDALDLVMTSSNVKSLVLVDTDGDVLSPALTNDSKFWKIYHKNKKVFSHSIMFAVTLVKTNLIDQLNPRKHDDSIEQSGTSLVVDDPKNEKTVSALNCANLEDACLKGDIAAVLSLLNSGADVSSTNEAGTQPIHFASVIGSVELARLLIAAGADVSATNDEGSTPLHFACEQGHEDLIMYFISTNASLTVQNASGIVPLDYLCSQGNDNLVLEVMNYLPDHEFALLFRLAAEHGIQSVVNKILNAHPALVDEEDQDQRTAMHYACLNGNFDVVKALNTFGANVRSKDADGMTPILYACSSGNLKLVKFLLAYASKVLLDDVDSNGNNCLHISCHLGHLDLTQYLVKLGMDIYAPNHDGATPARNAEVSGYAKIEKWIKEYSTRNQSGSAERVALLRQLYVCCSNNSVSEARRVLNLGADINGTDEGGNTPLHVAVANGCVEVARILFDGGSDVNAVNAAGFTPMAIACMRGLLEVVCWLHDIGVNIKSMIGGSSAIHYAGLMGKVEIVEYLLDQGCDVGMMDSTGAAPMHQAAHGNSLDVARLLFERGADVNATDLTGLAPIHIAAFRGNSTLVQWLLFSGADIESVDSSGRTPFLYSCMGGELKAAKLLDAKNANIYLTTASGNGALHLAAGRSHIQVIEWLIGKGLDINALNAKQQTPYQVSLLSCNKTTTDFFGSYFLKTNIVQPEAVVYQVAFEIFRTTNESNYPAAFFCLEEIMRRVEPMYRLPGDSLILHFAAAAGHINLIKFLLTKGCPPNCQSGTGRTPLHYAAIKGHVDVGEVLLQAGADRSLRDDSGKSALEYALQHNQSQFAKFLQSRVQEDIVKASTESTNFLFACLPVLGNSVPTNEINFAGSDDVHDVAVSGGTIHDISSSESVDEPASECQNRPDVNNDKFIPEDVEWFDLPPLVDIALENLALLTKHVGNYVSPSHSSEYVSPDIGDSKPVKQEVFVSDDKCDLNQVESTDNASNNLHLACAAGSLQNVQTLSGRGTDLNAKNSVGLTPLYIACDKQYGDIAIYLIKKGADLGKVCAPGDTPIHRICSRGMSSLLEQIIAMNLNVKLPLDVKSTSGLTLLHVAAMAGFMGIMKILVKHANVMNARDAQGKTALHHVCESGNLEMVEFLLMNGAFLNVRDSEGCTPILLAVKSGALEVVKLLSKNGASLSAEDNEGNSLLHMACRNGEIDMIIWLISAGGADKEAKNSKFKTPIDILVEGRFTAALKALEDFDESSV